MNLKISDDPVILFSTCLFLLLVHHHIFNYVTFYSLSHRKVVHIPAYCNFFLRISWVTSCAHMEICKWLDCFSKWNRENMWRTRGWKEKKRTSSVLSWSPSDYWLVLCLGHQTISLCQCYYDCEKLQASSNICAIFFKLGKFLIPPLLTGSFGAFFLL